ncbi:MAG: helix-turn-helix domain-containing protein, partial [Planctomycetota bacterium]
MAGMFYSLEEAAAKLNVSKEKIQELVKEGRLREFSDGPNLLFKVDEVESLMSDSKIVASQSEESDAEPMIELSDDEISLAPESDIDIPVGEELTEADTAVGAEGINVLSESDVADYKMTDDTMGDTVSGTAAGTGGLTGGLADEALDEIDESVNLDTFGSGSGLLDLSLQADDTSLGGILDEIYTPESG